MSMFLKIISFLLLVVCVIASNTTEGACSSPQNCTECLKLSECVWNKSNDTCLDVKSSCSSNNDTKNEECSPDIVRSCPADSPAVGASPTTENANSVNNSTDISTVTGETGTTEANDTGSTETPHSSTGMTQNDTSTETTNSTEKSTAASTETTDVYTTRSSTTSTDQSDTGGRQFDAPSFIGGIVLCLGLLAIAYVGYKFYRARTEHNYHTL